MSSSSSHSVKSKRSAELPTHCDCNPPSMLVLRTSWTSTNPARRFLTCPNSMSVVKRCKAFYFLDEEIKNDWYKKTLFDLYQCLRADERDAFREIMRNREMVERLNGEFELYKVKKEEEVVSLQMEVRKLQLKVKKVKDRCGFMKKCLILLLCIVVVLMVKQ